VAGRGARALRLAASGRAEGGLPWQHAAAAPGFEQVHRGDRRGVGLSGLRCDSGVCAHPSSMRIASQEAEAHVVGADRRIAGGKSIALPTAATKMMEALQPDGGTRSVASASTGQTATTERGPPPATQSTVTTERGPPPATQSTATTERGPPPRLKAWPARLPGSIRAHCTQCTSWAGDAA